MSAVDLTQLLQDAAAAIHRNDHHEARQKYLQILANTEPQTEHPTVRSIRLQAWTDYIGLLSLLGETEAALESGEQYYLEAGTSTHAVDALVLVGDQASILGEYSQAFDALQEGLRLAQALNYTSGQAKALGGLAVVFRHWGRTEAALVNLDKARTLFQQMDDQQGEARVLNWLGLTHQNVGQLDKAIVAFEESLRVARLIKDQEGLVKALSNLGTCYQNLYDMAQALSYHQEGLVIAQQTQVPSLTADVLRNLGMDLSGLNRYDEALPYLQEALAIAIQNGQVESELQALYSLALTALERKQTTQGKVYGEQLRVLAEQNSARDHVAAALHIAGLCHKLENDLISAEQVWQQAIFLAHETGQRQLLWRLHAAMGQIATNSSLRQVHYRIAGDVIRQIVAPIEDEALRNKFLTAPAVQEIIAAAP